MSDSKYTPDNVVNELQWISFKDKDPTFTSKMKSKGVIGIMVPIGCIATAGVLGMGMFQMYKSNSKKQQFYMRLRVVSQGVTIATTALGILYLGKFH